MQAITISEYGGPEKLEYGEAPFVATERKSPEQVLLSSSSNSRVFSVVSRQLAFYTKHDGH